MRGIVASILIALIVWGTCATDSTAQSDGIFLFGDSLRTTCTDTLMDEYLVIFHMYHYAPSGAQGSRLRIPREPCIVFGNISGPGLYTSLATTGMLEGGIEFSYGECRTGWIYLGAFSYYDVMGLGGLPTCCEQLILPHPSATTGMVESIDCAGTAQVVTAHTGIIKGNDTCPCPVVTGIVDNPPTWGRVKALYQQE
jgi:hypothetical protein